MNRLFTTFVPFLLPISVFSYAEIPGLTPEKNWDLGGRAKR